HSVSRARASRGAPRQRSNRRGTAYDDLHVSGARRPAAFLPLRAVRGAAASARSGDAVGTSRGVGDARVSSGGRRVDSQADAGLSQSDGLETVPYRLNATTKTRRSTKNAKKTWYKEFFFVIFVGFRAFVVVFGLSGRDGLPPSRKASADRRSPGGGGQTVPAVTNGSVVTSALASATVSFVPGSTKSRCTYPSAIGRFSAGDRVLLVTRPTSRSPLRITAPGAGTCRPSISRPTSLRATRPCPRCSPRITTSCPT